MRLTFMARAMAAATVTGTLLLPAVGNAQPGGVSAACSIDPNQPKELAIQSLAFQRAKSSQNPEDRKKVLMGVLKELDTKPERFAKNPTGYNYILSQALVMWAVEPGVGATPTRGSLGFVSNPAEPYDIIDGLDASFKAMAAASPECAEDVKALRQNEAWLALTQAALSASNGGQLDSAEYYAKRSLKLSGDSPYPHYVLANVANTRGDKKGAVLHWGHVVSIAGSDTTYRDLKNTSLYYTAMTKLELASGAQGADQVALGKEAAEAFKATLEANPESPDAANLYNGWADALTLAKDTANIPQVYAGLLSSPDKATDITMTMAGVIATRANRVDDALKLFELAVQKNPYNRDGLRNLAATYYGREKYQEMFAPSKKLVELDPNNYDGWMMFAYASQGLGKNAKAPAEKKAWTDSLVKYNTIAEGLPVKVDVAGFSRGGQTSTLTLSLEQVAAADGNYAVTVEFLDASGNVVANATEQSGPIKKGERKELAFKASGDKIYGYRYKPIK
ncbi:MAG: hypothetical protein K2Y26_02505 [Gemmatimonadaceae bacterium]|nr:hypothetical protein [Gemmatimonas sp.]MBX9854363.1 hypothetical protein [Gemmatimonadaceae bacterium]